MASELAKAIGKRLWGDVILGPAFSENLSEIDAELVPVWKALLHCCMCVDDPCDVCQQAGYIADSLDPNPEGAEGKWTVNKNISEEDRSPAKQGDDDG